jgi:hypothetical protein
MARLGLLLIALVSAVAFCLGLWLWCRPAWRRALSVRVRHLRLPLPFRIERIIYRHHQLFGGLIVAGALIVLAQALALPLGHLPPMTGGGTDHVLVPWATKAITAILILGSLFALAVGLAVFFRPSLLRPLETWGNRAYSRGQALRALRRAWERVVLSHPRPTGAIIALGALYVLVRSLKSLLV